MVSINFVGDIGLFKEFQVRNIDPFNEIRLPGSDYNIANFEFVIPDKKIKYFFDVLDRYTVDYEYFKALNLNVFHAFGLANNHIMDYGPEGVEDVIDVFEKKNISHFGTGTEKFSILRKEINGISFAFIAFVKDGRWSKKHDGDFGPDSYDVEEVIRRIRSLKDENTDHVIIFPHFGSELVDIPDPVDIKNSRLFIDNGASAVIGHHPHIIQGIEKYRNGLIAYSLGSFIYIPENELGYSKNQGQNRDYSLCLNLVFSKNDITGINPHYYKYDFDSKVPLEFKQRIQYFDYLNDVIGNSREYHKKIRRVLIKRELLSFFQRFKNAPLDTSRHYLKYLRLSHLKKMFSRN